MPRAHAGVVKYHYMDHDTEQLLEAPPVQNQWYEVFHDEDVRLLACTIHQKNDEIAVKDVEIRWTIDGNVYFCSIPMDDDTIIFVYRTLDPSTGGTAGLYQTVLWANASFYEDKRGLDFKVEVRMTSVPGTNQSLLCRCVKETLELT